MLGDFDVVEKALELSVEHFAVDRAVASRKGRRGERVRFDVG